MIGRSRPLPQHGGALISRLLAVLAAGQQAEHGPAGLLPARSPPTLTGELTRLIDPRKADIIFQWHGFSCLKVAVQSLRGGGTLLYEAHRRNIASI